MYALYLYNIFLKGAHIKDIWGYLTLKILFINRPDNRFLKSTLKGLFLNVIIKSQQEHPLCSPILIFTARTKESNIFT